MLHNEKELFEQVILRTADALRIEPGIIEKDYFVTMFLKKLAAKQPNIVFKGGTSLSKCHRLIHRFSEDMCAHNGTHIDAPFHFIKDGKTVDEICLEAFVGMAYVAVHHGIVTGDDAVDIIEKAKKQNPEATKRILIKGDIEVSLEAAKIFASSDILLLGNEPQTIGPQNAPMAVHLVLLRANVILLEGIRLSEVSEGVYFLNAAPLNLSGADGSPCRAVLIAVER